MPVAVDPATLAMVKVALGAAVAGWLAGQCLRSGFPLPLMPGAARMRWRAAKTQRMGPMSVGSWLALLGVIMSLIVFVSPLITTLVTTTSTVERDRKTFEKLELRIERLESELNLGERFTLQNGVDMAGDIKQLCVAAKVKIEGLQVDCASLGRVR